MNDKTRLKSVMEGYVPSRSISDAAPQAPDSTHGRGSGAIAAPSHASDQVTSDSVHDFEEAGHSHGCFMVFPVPLLMIDFILQDQSHAGYPYMDLRAVQFDSSGTLKLIFSDAQVTITGRNLTPLHKAILGHRATSLRQSARLRGSENQSNSTAIEAIRIDVT